MNRYSSIILDKHNSKSFDIAVTIAIGLYLLLALVSPFLFLSLSLSLPLALHIVLFLSLSLSLPSLSSLITFTSTLPYPATSLSSFPLFPSPFILLCSMHNNRSLTPSLLLSLPSSYSYSSLSLSPSLSTYTTFSFSLSFTSLPLFLFNYFYFYPFLISLSLFPPSLSSPLPSLCCVVYITQQFINYTYYSRWLLLYIITIMTIRFDTTDAQRIKLNTPFYMTT